ncbi:MAG: alpha/beta fold hydrolase [Bacteroidia bacterium]
MSSKGAHTLYLFPGQGSDHEIFSKMEFSDSFSLKHMELPTPRSGERMREYATRFISQIDTNQRYSLIGVSLGGMICSELADVLNPENVIVISSAKCSSELPGRYRFQRVFPLNKAIPASWYNGGALFLQPIVEPDRNQEKETFIRMLNRKDKTYMKRAVDMIVNWDKKSYNQKIVHIHGVSDHTIPIRNVKATMVIPDGSHMMALTRGQEIGRAIVEVLNQTSVSL